MGSLGKLPAPEAPSLRGALFRCRIWRLRQRGCAPGGRPGRAGGRPRLDGWRELEAFGKTLADPAVEGVLASHGCWLAPAEEAAGHPDKADAILKTGGTYLDCYRFRADILDQRGDWAAAQKTYADAVALAPDLPAGYYSWGLALAKLGDLDGAAAKFKDANQKGPHWADPLKSCGDVLMQQGHTKQALVKYDQALKYAPNWAALKEVREAVAKPKT